MEIPFKLGYDLLNLTDHWLVLELECCSSTSIVDLRIVVNIQALDERVTI